MSMHIERAWLSTTSTKKKVEKLTKAKHQELEQGWRERNVRLREMGLPKETIEQYTDWVYGRSKKEKKKAVESTIIKKAITTPLIRPIKDPGGYAAPNTGQKSETLSKTPKSLGEWITGPVSSKPSPMYTGEKILGIGTMHKSNAVPIFSDNEAKDISKMRR